MSTARYIRKRVPTEIGSLLSVFAFPMRRTVRGELALLFLPLKMLFVVTNPLLVSAVLTSFVFQSIPNNTSTDSRAAVKLALRYLLPQEHFATLRTLPESVVLE